MWLMQNLCLSSPSHGRKSVLEYKITVLSVCVSLRRLQGLVSWQAPAVSCLFLPLLVCNIVSYFPSIFACLILQGHQAG